MKTGSKLTIRTYPISTVAYGKSNSVNANGRMDIDPSYGEVLAAKYTLIEKIDIRRILPDEHDQHTNTIMDIIPLATKALGKVGEGITNNLSGVYVILTGIDSAGRQVCNFGSSDGILKEKVAWGKMGTPLESDILISFDVVLKEGTWTDRSGPESAHSACDEFCQIFRQQMKAFPSNKCAEKVTFQEDFDPFKKDIYIVKEVSGQGAVYDTRVFGREPGGYEGGHSVIDMGWMPVLVTPNEFRDGIMRAMD